MTTTESDVASFVSDVFAASTASLIGAHWSHPLDMASWLCDSRLSPSYLYIRAYSA